MADPFIPVPRQVKAARALLAWTQGELAKEAGIAVSTLADFERGERTPVSNNALAIAAALERHGIVFTRGGAVTGPADSAVPKSATGGQVLRWISAQDLSEWAGRRDGPAGLPELISRLITVSCGPTALRFPADDSIVHAGWDGIAETFVATAFVPSGLSAWELGAQRQRIERKAEEDYRKRSADPLGVEPAQSTYVFVTPHRWPLKDEWAAAKRAEGIWQDVRAIDGDALVHWLELHAGVAEWLAVRIGRRPAGLRGVTEVWEEWSLATHPPLTPGIIMADRDEEAVKVLRWLRAEPSVLAIQAEASDEAIAFFYATVDQLPDPYRLYWLSRSVVTDIEAAARGIGGLAERMVVVMTTGDAGLAARLARDGHHVLAAYGSEVGAPVNVLRLSRAWRHTIERALEDAGVEPVKARGYASAAGRSLAVLRRLMPAGPAKRPRWAQPPVSTVLLGAMLAGAWDSANPIDCDIVGRLCNSPYKDVEETLAPFAAALDGPIRRSGAIWKLTSLRDTWFLLAGYLTAAQVEALGAIFLYVLGEVSPRYDNPGFHLRFERTLPTQASPELRRGLSEAMIALGVWPDRASGVTDAAFRSERAVADLLGAADERRWWSLAHDFRRLAEAAPDAFLAAIDRALAVRLSPMASLFRSDEGLMHANEYLADLMWALEILCWSPDHVGAATLILARLADVDPGGKINNRPKETLARIFLPWRPQTFASPAERLQQIDLILRRWPAVGWDLLHAIAPSMGGFTHPTSKPLWRDFSTDAPEVITHRSVREMYAAIGDRLLDAAGTDASRWEIVLEHWPNFEPDWRDKADERLTAAIVDFDEEARNDFREKLRLFIAKHARFPDTPWSLKGDELAPLEAIFDALEPASLLTRKAWLFGVANPLFDPALSWQEQQQRQEAEQIAAIEAIAAEFSAEAVAEYAVSVGRPETVGSAVALSTIAADGKEAMLTAAFARLPETERLLNGLLFGLRRHDGEAAVRQRVVAAIDDRRPTDEIVAMALVLEAASDTWALVASAGDDVDRTYWQRLQFYTVPKTEDLEVFTDKALAVGRGRAILAFIAGQDDLVASGELLLRILRNPSTIGGSSNAADDDSGMLSWYVGKVFERLDAIGGLDDEIAALEWIYFQALRHSERPPRVLYRLLASDPDFFVMLMKSLYSASGDAEPEPPDATNEDLKTIATQAFHVLEEWSRVPGTNDDGTIVAAKLAAWVKGARAGCAVAHRSQIGDYRIGVILSAPRRVPGEPWPPEAIREVIEDAASDDLDDGFVIGRFNRRGITTRMPNDGGGQERELAAEYREDAKASSLVWPRTRAALERIAKGYDADAEREDQSAEQRDW